MKNLMVAMLACAALAVGCGSDSGCDRLGDLAVMCESISSEDRDSQVTFCEALVPDSDASRCADCREAAADPCADGICVAECGD